MIMITAPESLTAIGAVSLSALATVTTAMGDTVIPQDSWEKMPVQVMLMTAVVALTGAVVYLFKTNKKERDERNLAHRADLAERDVIMRESLKKNAEALEKNTEILDKFSLLLNEHLQFQRDVTKRVMEEKFISKG